MNFELNEDQQAFVDAAKEFAASEMAPFAAEWDEESFFQKNWRTGFFRYLFT